MCSQLFTQAPSVKRETATRISPAAITLEFCYGPTIKKVQCYSGSSNTSNNNGIRYTLALLLFHGTLNDTKR